MTVTTGLPGTMAFPGTTCFPVGTMQAPATMVPAAMALPGTFTMQAPMAYSQAPVGAPTMYAAAPTVTALTPSYAPQVMMQPPSYVPQGPQALMAAGNAGAMPAKLTEGMPTTQQISQQKALYAAALDKQLREASETVTKEVDIEKQMATFATQKDIAMYEMQVDEHLTEQLAECDEVATFAILELKKAFVHRQLQLTAQANGLVTEYNTQEMHTDIVKKQNALQQQLLQAEKALAVQYGQQVAKASTPTPVAVQASAAAPVAAK